MSFDQLKRNSGSFSSLQAKMKADQAGAKSFADDRFWSLTVDKAGNGYAVIRFLPQVAGEEVPYVMRYEHAFKDDKTGKWFIDNCATTIGQPCACCDANSELWNTGIEANQNIVRGRKRQKRYYANIMVIEDSSKPENNGKVFMYKFGPKIFQKICDAIDPQFPDEKPVDVFDFWNGANFKLKANNISGQRSYDKSDFDSPSALLNGEDEKLAKVYESQHKLQELVAESEFKAYPEVQKRLNTVLGITSREPVDNSTYDSVKPQASAPSYHNDTPPFDTTPATTSNDDSDLDEYTRLLNGN